MKAFFCGLLFVAAGLFASRSLCQQTNKGERVSGWQLNLLGAAAGYGRTPLEPQEIKSGKNTTGLSPNEFKHDEAPPTLIFRLRQNQQHRLTSPDCPRLPRRLKPLRPQLQSLTSGLRMTKPQKISHLETQSVLTAMVRLTRILMHQLQHYRRHRSAGRSSAPPWKISAPPSAAGYGRSPLVKEEAPSPGEIGQQEPIPTQQARIAATADKGQWTNVFAPSWKIVPSSLSGRVRQIMSRT